MEKEIHKESVPLSEILEKIMSEAEASRSQKESRGELPPQGFGEMIAGSQIDALLEQASHETR